MSRRERFQVIQRVTRDRDVVVSQHRTRAAAEKAIADALPGDQPEMRVEEQKDTWANDSQT